MDFDSFFNMRKTDDAFPISKNDAGATPIVSIANRAAFDETMQYHSDNFTYIMNTKTKEELGRYADQAVDRFLGKYVVTHMLGMGVFGGVFATKTTCRVNGNYGNAISVVAVKVMLPILIKSKVYTPLDRYRLCRPTDSEVVSQFIITQMVGRHTARSRTQGLPIMVNVVRIFDWFTIPPVKIEDSLERMGISDKIKGTDKQKFSGRFSGRLDRYKDGNVTTEVLSLPFYVTVMEKCDDCVKDIHFKTIDSSKKFFSSSGAIGDMFVQIAATLSSLNSSIGFVHGDLQLSNVLMSTIEDSKGYKYMRYKVNPTGNTTEDSPIYYYVNISNGGTIFKLADFSLSSCCVKVRAPGTELAAGVSEPSSSGYKARATRNGTPPMEAVDVPVMLGVSAVYCKYSSAADIHRLGSAIVTSVLSLVKTQVAGTKSKNTPASYRRAINDVMGLWLPVIRDMLVIDWLVDEPGHKGSQMEKVQLYFEIMVLMLDAVALFKDEFTLLTPGIGSAKRNYTINEAIDFLFDQKNYTIDDGNVNGISPHNMLVGLTADKFLRSAIFESYMNIPADSDDKNTLYAEEFLAEKSKEWFEIPQAFVVASVNSRDARR